MKKDEVLKVSNIYIGFEIKDVYDEFSDQYVEYNEIVALNKTDYCFKINDESKVQVFKNINTGEKVFLKNDNSVFHDDDSLVENHFIDNLVSIETLFEKVNNSDRIDSNYRKQIMSIYSVIMKTIKNKEKINYIELKTQVGNICALYIYCFNYFTEEDYEEFFHEEDSKVLDFENCKRNLRKK